MKKIFTYVLLHLSVITIAQTTLTANNAFSNINGFSSILWGDNVVLTAQKIDGTAGKVIYDEQFNDKGFGILGARWHQIDYYKMYQGTEVNTSEKLVIQFNGLVNNIVFTVGMLGLDEGNNGDDETGNWLAYNNNNVLIASGNFGPAESTLGVNIKINNSYGMYPIAVNTSQPVAKLIIEATGFGYGFGTTTNVSSYNNESNNTENNSDFNIVNITYTRQILNTVAFYSLNNKPLVFPNPTNGFLNFNDEILKIGFKNYELYNLTGMLLENNEEKILNMENYPNGIYFLKVNMINQTVFFEKIIKN
jgi:Secretion system C-terminal sorting domain